MLPVHLRDTRKPQQCETSVSDKLLYSPNYDCDLLAVKAVNKAAARNKVSRSRDGFRLITARIPHFRPFESINSHFATPSCVTRCAICAFACRPPPADEKSTNRQ